MDVGRPNGAAGSRWALNSPGQNHILSGLPLADRERTIKRCEKREWGSAEVFFEAHVPLTHGYFPLSGFASLVTTSDSSEGGVEVGLSGNEGFVGIDLFLQSDASVRAVCQAPGTFLSIPAAVLKQELESSANMRTALARYAHTVMTQMSQSVLCNNAHAMEERLCRWLLAAHDRLSVDELPLTQTFLSQMLGVRRPSVTVAAGMLKKAGLIEYSRGNIQVVDRAGLEAGACECYRVIRKELERHAS